MNRTQRARAAQFLKKLRGLAKEVLIADKKEFAFGETKLRFSQTVFHGTGPKMGYVVQVCIQEEYRFLHTSDVQEPCNQNQASFALQEDPQEIFCDGPVTYMPGRRYSVENLNQAMNHLSEIVEKTQVQKLVLDHHLLRDLKWKEKLESVFSGVKSRDVELLTAAEYAGMQNDLLEARRWRLYGR